MILYHSSDVAVKTPDILHSRNNIDFGRGGHLTSLRDQAVSYAQRFIRRGKTAWINSYEINYDPSEWRIKVFEAYDHAWLDFISKCRAGNDVTNSDMVIGGIAIDKVIRTLDRYFENEINAAQTIGLLKYQKPNIQFCIRSQAMLDKCLTHIESKQL